LAEKTTEVRWDEDSDRAAERYMREHVEGLSEGELEVRQGSSGLRTSRPSQDRGLKRRSQVLAYVVRRRASKRRRLGTLKVQK
jgi:hypothetical protein